MTYYEINGSLNSFGDVCRQFISLERAKAVYAEMKRDGVKHLELKKVVENSKCYYSESISIN